MRGTSGDVPGKGVRPQAAGRLATALLFSACLVGPLPGCGEGLIVGGVIGLGVYAARGADDPEYVARCAAAGEGLYFYFCVIDPHLSGPRSTEFYFERIFFRRRDAKPDDGWPKASQFIDVPRYADARGPAPTRHGRPEPRLVVGPTGCALSWRF